MVNEPAGTTTISGQLAHSLKLSFGRSARSCEAVNVTKVGFDCTVGGSVGRRASR